MLIPRYQAGYFSFSRGLFSQPMATDRTPLRESFLAQEDIQWDLDIGGRSRQTDGLGAVGVHGGNVGADSCPPVCLGCSLSSGPPLLLEEAFS